MSHWTSQGISTAYAAFRPTYPAELFTSILSKVPSRNEGTKPVTRLVDIGCGTGQIFNDLAKHFSECLGVDPSPSQVAAATPFPNVKYIVGKAESFTIPSELGAWDGNVDLITVAQAMHWFDMPSFVERVDRLLRPGGVLAVTMYASIILEPEGAQKTWYDFDRLMLEKRYWPDGRVHIDNQYKDLLPHLRNRFTPLAEETFSPWKTLTVEGFINYMSTMSGVDRYKKQTGDSNILKTLESQYLVACGGTDPKTTTLRAKHDFLLFTFQKPIQSKL